MPARIIDAEHLRYCNPARNSDKIFNIFLVEEDDGRHSCISEYGRKGTSLVRVVVCSNKSLPVAERASGRSLKPSETIARRLIGILPMVQAKAHSLGNIAHGRTP